MPIGDEELISNFFRQDTEVALVSATISRKLPETQQFAGRGTAVLDADGFRVTLFVDDPDASRINKEFMMGFHTGGTSGKLMEKESLFDFEGTCLDRFTWKASGAVISASMNGTHCILSFHVHELVRSRNPEPQTTQTLTVWLAERIYMPGQQATHTTMKIPAASVPGATVPGAAGAIVDRFVVTAREVNGTSCYDIVSTDPLPPRQLADAIMQAACFLSGRPVPWVLLTIGDGFNAVYVFRPSTRKSLARMYTPLSTALAPGDWGDYWSLFGKCFEMAAPFGWPEWAPFGRVVWRAAEDSEGSMETQALGLAASVENLCSTVFAGLAPAPKSVVEAVDNAHELIAGLPDDVRRRIAGQIDQLRGERAQDVLRKLVDFGVITSEEVEAWSGLRNRYAHGKFVKLSKTQATWDQIALVTTLLHKLGFQICGYSGKYQNRGKPNWPLEDWKHVASAPPASPVSP